jgi:LmbE family N-acetylglucosaminyl deacetylase
MRSRHVLTKFFAVLSLWSTALVPAAFADSARPELSSPAAIQAELKSLQQLGAVLYVAAHPDDENTQLITYLARGRGYRTAYLSLTRGDGGQNVLSADFGERLGVARTQELLAARRLDGGLQFFTRALDFGFSKDYEETLSVWDEKAVLSDVVRVIRQFRPDVIVTRFSPQPGGTHGHHTASAVLVMRAFKLAADPTAFPEQLSALKPWQPKRIFWNVWRGGGKPGEVLQIDVAGEDPVHGMTFVELAGRSRAQHKTQGFDNFAIASGPGPRMETFQLLDGEPASADIMDGVQTGWARLPGGDAIDSALARIVATFDAAKPEASVPALLEVRRKILAFPTDAVLAEKRDQLDRILAACLGLKTATLVENAEVVAGETIQLTHEMSVASAAVPVRWKATRVSGDAVQVDRALTSQAPVQTSSKVTIPADAPLTQPYWLVEPFDRGMFKVLDASLIGQAENPPMLPVEHVVDVAGQEIIFKDEPIAAATRGGTWVTRRKLAIVAPVYLSIDSDVELFGPGATRNVAVEVRAMRPNLSGSAVLELPKGWTAAAPKAFSLRHAGDKIRLEFSVTAPNEAVVGTAVAHVVVGGKRYSAQRIEVGYAHVPMQLLQLPAKLRVVSMDVAKRGTQVGYVPGAGDTVAQSLRQIGYNVVQLSGADITPERLTELDAVVIGVRALNTRADLKDKMSVLFDYVERGGNVVVQYNNPGGLKVDKISPIDLKIANERVTDENAPITFLAAEHPVLNTPNKIGPEDFAGWVQERGLYFPNQWGAGFTPILACNDKGEPQRHGALLVARHGKGHFVYTGLSFFRQLPAGVPGAYRLFANLISLGK